MKAAAKSSSTAEVIVKYGSMSDNQQCRFKPKRPVAADRAMRNTKCGYEFPTKMDEEAAAQKASGEDPVKAWVKKQDQCESEKRGRLREQREEEERIINQAALSTTMHSTEGSGKENLTSIVKLQGGDE